MKRALKLQSKSVRRNTIYLERVGDIKMRKALQYKKGHIHHHVRTRADGKYNGNNRISVRLLKATEDINYKMPGMKDLWEFNLDEIIPFDTRWELIGGKEIAILNDGSCETISNAEIKKEPNLNKPLYD